MKAEKYYEDNIKRMIDNSYKSIGYIRGYITACSETKSIDIETTKKMNIYLKKNIDHVLKNNKLAKIGGK